SSRIAIRVSRGAAFMRISLFIGARLTTSRGDSASEGGRFKKVRAVVLQGRVMISLSFSPSARLIHVCGTSESRRFPMHEKQQSVRTIYGDAVCFRNGDNNLQAALNVAAEIHCQPDM